MDREKLIEQMSEDAALPPVWEVLGTEPPSEPSPWQMAGEAAGPIKAGPGDLLREIAATEGWNTRPTRTSDVMRKFDTGATRDTDTGKHDPEGFMSPLVIDRFNKFMHENRLQKDGKLRDSDNWQKGMSLDVYMKSKMRHDLDLWLHHRGFGDKAREDRETALCAILFNTAGYLFELLKDS